MEASKLLAAEENSLRFSEAEGTGTFAGGDQRENVDGCENPFAPCKKKPGVSRFPCKYHRTMVCYGFKVVQDFVNPQNERGIPPFWGKTREIDGRLTLEYLTSGFEINRRVCTYRRAARGGASLSAPPKPDRLTSF